MFYGNEEEFREIDLGDGNSIPVLASDYPWVTEWDWRLDEDTSQAYRIDRDGEKIFMYHEILAHRLQTHRVLPILDQQSVEAIFGEEDNYSKLGSWVEASQSFGITMGIDVPEAFKFITYSLTVGLVFYLRWLKSKQSIHWVVHTDPIERLGSPGHFIKKSQAQYETLRDWMYAEYTGKKDSNGEPVGYSELIAYNLLSGWPAFIVAHNEAKPEEEIMEFWMALDANNEVMPTSKAMMATHRIIENYPVPHHVWGVLS